MLASEIIRRVGIELSDATHVRWKSSELVDYINDAQRMIVQGRPDANAVIGSIQLSAGSKQKIPAAAGTDPAGVKLGTGIRFLRATRNMGSDGLTPGNAIREGSRVALDAEYPEWHTATGSKVEGFVFDNVSPATFYVYPAVAGSWIEIAYSALPDTVAVDGSGVPTTATNTLTLPDQYGPALIEYVLFKCYSRDSEDAGNMARSSAHLQAFGAALNADVNAGGMASSPQLATPTPAAPRMAA